MPACSTCSPAPARSALRRSRAAAKFALFVDNGAEARALLRNNVEALGLGGVTKVYRRDASNLGPAHPMEPFSLVFLDPPYRMKLAEKALASLRDGGWLTPGALLVVEEAKAAAFAAPDGFEELERRAYDDTEFVFLRSVRVGKAKRAHHYEIRRWARRRRAFAHPTVPPSHLLPNSFSISLSFNST